MTLGDECVNQIKNVATRVEEIHLCGNQTKDWMYWCIVRKYSVMGGLVEIGG